MAKKEKNEPKFCFIISHIGSKTSDERIDADRKLKHFFKPVLQELKYASKRSDDESTPGFISTQIIKRLIDSPLVIADISFENANVFYELAVRHAIKKPVIIIKKSGQKPPFDITDIRAIDVDMSDPDIWQPAMKDLKKYIKEAENNPKKASESILSNFTRSFNLQSKEDKESDTLRTVKDIKAQLNRVSTDVDSLKNKTSHVIDTDPGSFTIDPGSFTIGPGPAIGMGGIAGITNYLLKCKKCKVEFLASGMPPLTIGGQEHIKNLETCTHCFKQSSYSAKDYQKSEIKF